MSAYRDATPHPPSSVGHPLPLERAMISPARETNALRLTPMGCQLWGEEPSPRLRRPSPALRPRALYPMPASGWALGRRAGRERKQGGLLDLGGTR